MTNFGPDAEQTSPHAPPAPTRKACVIEGARVAITMATLAIHEVNNFVARPSRMIALISQSVHNWNAQFRLGKGPTSGRRRQSSLHWPDQSPSFSSATRARAVVARAQDASFPDEVVKHATEVGANLAFDASKRACPRSARVRKPSGARPYAAALRFPPRLPIQPTIPRPASISV